jgi:hypothetical protein
LGAYRLSHLGDTRTGKPVKCVAGAAGGRAVLPPVLSSRFSSI